MDLLNACGPGNGINADKFVPPDKFIRDQRQRTYKMGIVEPSSTFDWDLIPIAIEINRITKEGHMDEESRHRLLAEIKKVSKRKTTAPLKNNKIINKGLRKQKA